MFKKPEQIKPLPAGMADAFSRTLEKQGFVAPVQQPAPQPEVVAESAMSELSGDLRSMSDKEFQAQYKMTKAQMRAKLKGESVTEAVKEVPPSDLAKSPNTVKGSKNHQLGIGVDMKQMMQHAKSNRDIDVDGDVDKLDKSTPDEITGAEKKNQTGKMMMKYAKEKQHTKVGNAFESMHDGSCECDDPEYTSKGMCKECGKPESMSEAMDAVDKNALKKDFTARKDKDIDNNGKVDSSDEYLHKRRQAVSKSLAKEEVEIIDELSKGTLQRYSDAAHKDFSKNFQHDQNFTGIHSAIRTAMAKTNSGTGGVHSSKGTNKNPLRKHDAVQAGLKTAADAVTAARAPFKHKMKVRNQGMDRAYDRLNKEEAEVSLEEEDTFAGWIAIYKGKKIEIKKDQAKDLYGAKQLAIKQLNVPKSGVGILAIKPAYESYEETQLEDIEEGWDDMMKAAKERAKPQPNGAGGKKQGTAYGGSKQKDAPKKDDMKESVKVGDKVSFDHPMTAAPGKTMKKVGTVKKIEGDTAHLKSSTKYGTLSYQKKVSELRKEEVELGEAPFNPLKHVKNPSAAVKTAAKDVKRGSYADRAALMKAGGVKDDRGPRGVTQEEVAELAEAPSYKLYHTTFSAAVQEAIAVAKKQGYEVDEEDWQNKVATGPKKPSKDKTNSYSIGLMKNGSATKKKLQIQVYNMGEKYELNTYVQ